MHDSHAWSTKFYLTRLLSIAKNIYHELKKTQNRKTYCKQFFFAKHTINNFLAQYNNYIPVSMADKITTNK